jgi:ferredoxin
VGGQIKLPAGECTAAYREKGGKLVIREIITIDEERCDGCGVCVPNCPEGALQIIDDKARLVSDLFCDGLGACIGHCPQGAITIEKREAEEYDERKVMENIVRQGENVIRAHIEHLKEHGANRLAEEAVDYLIEHDIRIPEFERDSAESRIAVGGGAAGNPGARAPVREITASGHAGAAGCGCPGARVVDLREVGEHDSPAVPAASRPSQLRQWPVQIMLVPPFAPYLQGADLLVAADCVPFAYADFHDELLRDRVLLVGCPKLDNADYYAEKLTTVFEQNDITSVTVAIMEVPCCSGMMHIVKSAVSASGKDIPVDHVTAAITGEIT